MEWLEFFLLLSAFLSPHISFISLSLFLSPLPPSSPSPLSLLPSLPLSSPFLLSLSSLPSLPSQVAKRSSRIFPVRCSTVLVHGEALVIRKLVVAGIVSAEKSYLNCLMVMKEVSATGKT